MAKGRIHIDEGRCQGCALCFEFCSNKVIAIATETLNAKGYHPAVVVSPENCTGCSVCALVCPDVAITVERGKD
ncbi:MAG: 4Fe-4S binding protein [Oscillospiraceae bacterium]|nr:4Fe-4S binding protein [Oscillospiraceae bacterium]